VGKRVAIYRFRQPRNAGFKRTNIKGKGVKELLVERTISIRRHATATLTRLENK
jgi:hypothetical protein